MEAKIEAKIKIQPFTVPNFVDTSAFHKDETNVSLPISNLDDDTLNRLCDEFRDAVFQKARGIKSK